MVLSRFLGRDGSPDSYREIVAFFIKNPQS